MYSPPFLDFDKLNEKMIFEKVPSYDKLKFIYKNMGGRFHDKEERLITGSKAALIGIGGLPISIEGNDIKIMNNKIDMKDLKESLYTMMGFSAGMSYLNPNNKSHYSLAEKTLSLGHNSIKHTIYLNILLVGISSGVEHEYSSQRDLIHLSRLTVAKTVAQKFPCLVLMNPDYIDVYKSILLSHDKLNDIVDRDKDLETSNILYPSAKASMIILSGTLRNFEKLVDLKNSGGKEREFLSSLEQIETVINHLF